jgi:hypothetical protein
MITQFIRGAVSGIILLGLVLLAWGLDPIGFIAER